MKIKLKIQMEKTSWLVKTQGVYRVDFDNGMFYIGSSTDLQKRASSWVGFLESRTKGYNRDIKRMREKISGCNDAVFSVVEFIVDGLRIAEYRHIKSNERNPLLLNTFSFHSLPIIEFDLNGNEIARYTSASQAGKMNGWKVFRIRRVLTGVRNEYKGRIFKYEDQELAVRLSKKPPRIKVYMYNLEGVFIDSFYGVTDAAKRTGISKYLIRDVVNGRQKKTHGFIFKRN